MFSRVCDGSVDHGVWGRGAGFSFASCLELGIGWMVMYESRDGGSMYQVPARRLLQRRDLILRGEDDEDLGGHFG